MRPSGLIPRILRPIITGGGLAYLNLGQLQRAIQDLDEAIRSDPQDAMVYANRALAYTMLGRDGAAQQDFERAAEMGFDAARLKEIMEELKRQR